MILFIHCGTADRAEGLIKYCNLAVNGYHLDSILRRWRFGCCGAREILIDIGRAGNSSKVAYYTFLEKKIKILKSVKLKLQDVSSEVLVSAVEVKCNFT